MKTLYLLRCAKSSWNAGRGVGTSLHLKTRIIDADALPLAPH
jgi:hypothetical protein